MKPLSVFNLDRRPSAGATPRVEIDHTRMASRGLSPHEIFGLLGRSRALIVATVLIFLAMGVGYILLATPQFTATASMLVDANGARPFPGPQSPDTRVDVSSLYSQIEIIKSEDIASAVVRKLNLGEDPEFNTPKLATFQAVLESIRWVAPAILDRIFGPSGKPQTPRGHALHIAITNVVKSLEVNRVRDSYIAEINFTSADPDKAALIANAIADVYIDNALDNRIYNTQRADNWIRRRVVDLHENVQNASDALDKFKAAASAMIEAGNLSIQQRDSKIQQLQSTADSYKSIYVTFLNLSRYVQSVQEQSFPITQARIINKAEPPQKKSWPKTKLTLAASLLLGTMIGFGAAFARGLLDDRIRTPIQLERDLGATCLGFIPTVSQSHRRRPTSDAGKALHDRGIVPLLDDCNSSAGAGEVLRALRTDIDANLPSGRCCLIGITSAFPDEGTTTLAANLATIFHEADRRVLLVDGDIRNHAISNRIATQRGNGIVKPIDKGLYAVASGQAKLADVVISGPFGQFLPVETEKYHSKHPADFWSLPSTGELFETAKRQYEVIIFDLPPLLAHVDAEAAGAFLEAFIIVAKYGNTKVDDLHRALNESGNIARHLLGVIVNNSPVVAERGRLERGNRGRSLSPSSKRRQITAHEADAGAQRQPFKDANGSQISSSQV